MSEKQDKLNHRLAQHRLAEHRYRQHHSMPMRNRRWKRQQIKLYYAKIRDKDLYQ